MELRSGEIFRREIFSMADGKCLGYADELLLSYNGNTWEGESPLEWEDTQQAADGMSFCPPLYRNHLSFYQDGILCDQLYARTTTLYGENIHLSFQHLFARVVFDVSEQLLGYVSARLSGQREQHA